MSPRNIVHDCCSEFLIKLLLAAALRGQHICLVATGRN
jgi:hypothetical protein